MESTSYFGFPWAIVQSYNMEPLPSSFHKKDGNSIFVRFVNAYNMETYRVVRSTSTWFHNSEKQCSFRRCIVGCRRNCGTSLLLLLARGSCFGTTVFLSFQRGSAFWFFHSIGSPHWFSVNVIFSNIFGGGWISDLWVEHGNKNIIAYRFLCFPSLLIVFTSTACDGTPKTSNDVHAEWRGRGPIIAIESL